VGVVLTWPIIYPSQEKCAPMMGTAAPNMGVCCEARFFAGDPARLRHGSTCRLCIPRLFIQSLFSNRYEHPDAAFLDHSFSFSGWAAGCVADCSGELVQRAVVCRLFLPPKTFFRVGTKAARVCYSCYLFWALSMSIGETGGHC
jgi:hypothetical protein